MHTRWSSARVVVMPLALVLMAGSALATGPIEQVVPWRNAVVAGKYDRLNSVVQLVTNNSLGTGTVIGTRFDGTDYYLCVVTANHVVNGATSITAQFGDGGSEGVFGGAVGAPGTASSSWFVTHGPEDLSVVSIKVNANPTGAAAGLTKAQFVGRINTPTMIQGLTNLSNLNGTTFTQVGYGGTGSFAQWGNGAAGVGIQSKYVDLGVGSNPRYVLDIDNAKRFQNNSFTTTRNVTAGYTYTGVDFVFNVPAAAGILAGEGLSYAGDSGGPYFYTGTNSQAVGAIARPDQVGPASVVPDWAAGNMDLFDQTLVAIHTYGNSIPGGAGTNGAPPFNNPMDGTSFGGGLPLTQDRVDWISGWCSVVPGPGAGSVLVLAGIMGMGRRRRR